MLCHLMTVIVIIIIEESGAELLNIRNRFTDDHLSCLKLKSVDENEWIFLSMKSKLIVHSSSSLKSKNRSSREAMHSMSS